MKFLLDTHALLWIAFDSEKLSKNFKEKAVDPENEIIVSTISFWELSLKYSLGKIKLSVSPERIVVMADKIGVAIVQPRISEYSTFHNLSQVNSHKDPFDRMIIWQAIRNDWTLILRDASFKEYQQFGLKLFW